MVAIWLFHLGFKEVLAISLVYTIGVYTYRTRKGGFKLLQLLKSIAITCLFIGAVFGYFYLFGSYGLLAFVIFVLVLSAYLIYKGRVMFMESMRSIEAIIFGKPLDKDNWKDGEKPKAKRLGLSRLWRRKV